MAINTPEQLYEALDTFGTEPVVAHLNDVAHPAVVIALAARFNCVAGGAEIVYAAIEQRTEPAPEAPAVQVVTPSKARKWNGSKWIRAEKRLAIYLRDSFMCLYCGKNLAAVRAKLRTLDHVTPVALGGSNDASNLATCCKRCNDRKQDRTASDFCTDDNRFQVLVEQLVKPLNVKLAKSILEGTLDLSDVLEQVQ